MSLIYCEQCNRTIDTDLDVEHFEEHRIKKERDEVLTTNNMTKEEGYIDTSNLKVSNYRKDQPIKYFNPFRFRKVKNK